MALRTPLHDTHVRAGARIVEFAGWQMPVQYSGILAEHETVRTRVGLFDVSHMGEVVFRGPRAIAALGRLFTNDLSKVADGQAQYGCLCRDSGGIVDDVVVYRRSAEDLLVCVNAGNRQKDFEWLAGHAAGADVRNESDDWAQLALQGPLAAQLLQRLTTVNLSAMRSYRFGEGEVAGVRCIVARTGYTGEDGFELFCRSDLGPRLWDALMEAGVPERIAPCGLGARDSLRLEMAYRLYGSDMDETTTPLEAGLAWVVKLDKGDFIGREALLKQKEQGLSRKLVGFQLTDAGIPRHGYPVLQDGRKVGDVTSGTKSPSLGTAIGLAYVPPALAAEGSTFAVEIRGRAAAAKAVKTPFYTRK
ncbi:glycine cleavage system T protein [Anaeromyxobacter dehalogenans 2CP-1]|uniref:Aminomethyltransferase n=1 Tax=Anaeromyxobacter dehalogenans (strain ATCC BAA-258 / DSM 21875 / 2CP-1) TaxID=455488 RepID=B8JDY6_ANAD2|nr:glycine cleavage system aminomethyltransferase GcvT [Anaeromyxobacter dehalogenans]ACL66051.1 glycine cleavage system T protein [Anaeromyxobacter dehalogenans 2CP-1]